MGIWTAVNSGETMLGLWREEGGDRGNNSDNVQRGAVGELECFVLTSRQQPRQQRAVQTGERLQIGKHAARPPAVYYEREITARPRLPSPGLTPVQPL